MVRNIVIIGGSSHHKLTQTICDHLGVPMAKIQLGKFAVGETSVKIGESVRGKDVFIIQSAYGNGKVNDHLMELLITISACRTASAKKITAVLPLFPYSRQSDIPYNKTGAPLSKADKSSRRGTYTLDSQPQTPHPGQQESVSLPNHANALNQQLGRLRTNGQENGVSRTNGSPRSHADGRHPQRSNTLDSNNSDNSSESTRSNNPANPPTSNGTSANANGGLTRVASKEPQFQPQPGYKQWVAQAGTLIADLLICAGADHVITMDLHDPQYQGFFDIPVDNLYGRHLLRKYIQFSIPNYLQAVIVSPDAGGAKRATAIADALGMPFALIHKERRPTQINDRQNATMMLVGDVSNRTTILIDDLIDTAETITRAAKLLKKEGATKVYALITHGILSRDQGSDRNGDRSNDAIDRINASALDKVVVTNSVDQTENQQRCPKLEVLEVGNVFAEAIRRVHHGESISVLFDYN